MKILRGKSLFGLIYACLLAFPLISIVSRVIYVQSNKNAYQSYSDNYIQTSTKITNDESYQIGANYQINYVATSGTTYTNKIYFSKISFNPSDYGFTDAYNYTYFRTRSDGWFYFGDDVNPQQAQQVWGTDITTFNFTSNANFEGTNTWEQGSAVFYLLNYKQNNLDNVFEYSIDKTISNNNFGRINFLTWFTDLFLDNNEVNNRYVHYANWYMNYIMFVSCAYLLFLVLMWFINFARKLLDRGMNYDW